jgi:transcriptional regulator with XRE-family HTH domain
MADEPKHLTANQVVAYNLARIRKARGLTQEQAAERLAPYVGAIWSKKVYSAAERSYDGGRVRQFTADDLTAFSLAFGVPLWFFLVPPKPEDRGGAVGVQSGERSLTWRETFGVITGTGSLGATMMRVWELPAEDRPDRGSQMERILAASTIGRPSLENLPEYEPQPGEGSPE